MKRFFYILILFSFLKLSIGQTNLVPNGSFETYVSCPTATSNFITNVVPWTAPYNNSADYYNACSSANFCNVPHYAGITGPYSFCSLQAKEGSAYVGFFAFQIAYREYIQVKLSDTLKNNSCYYAEFYASNMQQGKYKCNNIAASFISNAYPDNGPNSNVINIPQHITNYGNPVLQDTAKWHKISGLYQATGSEKYIILGNFKNDSNTDTVNLYPPGAYSYNLSPFSYIFIDAVSVYSINPSSTLPWSYNDTTIVLGDSVYIGNYMGGNFNPSWYTYSGNFIASNAGITVTPTITSQYIVQFNVCGVAHADTVKVTVLTDVGIDEQSINSSDLIVSPNPNNGLINISISDKDFVFQNSSIKIYDMFNREIENFKLLSKNQSFPIHDLHDGVYYLQLYQGDKMLLTKKIVKQ